jgi:carboxypeptidase Taq
MIANEAFNNLLQIYRNISILQQASSILGWDFETYMPPKGVKQRSEQLALLASLIHERKTDPHIEELISKIKETELESLSEVDKRNLYLIEKEYEKQTRVPKELVEKIAKQETISTQIWKKAKKEKKYSLFKPELDKLLELVKLRARHIDSTKHPFDVLIDEFEPGMTSERITKLFNELKAGLIPLIKKCTESPNQADISIIQRKCPIDIQRELSNDIANLVQYNLEKGRIDETEHPFTTGYFDDVRITTHYFEDDFSFSFFAVLHEAGHAIYEQNISRDYIYQPVGEIKSLGLHESQSRFIENIIGRSREFWEYYFPKLKQITGNIFSNASFDSFVHAINDVKRTKIRIFADEVTYCLHIVIRFEIERDLLSGKITTEELPQAWNTKYKEYLRVNIEDDSEGVMQDTHWASGLFGYFPTYALGNIYNAQFFKTMKNSLDYEELLKNGELKPIIEWLIKNVHEKANLYDPPDLIKRICEEEVDTKYFIKYLNEKYSKIYGF